MTGLSVLIFALNFTSVTGMTECNLNDQTPIKQCSINEVQLGSSGDIIFKVDTKNNTVSVTAGQLPLFSFVSAVVINNKEKTTAVSRFKTTLDERGKVTDDSVYALQSKTINTITIPENHSLYIRISGDKHARIKAGITFSFPGDNLKGPGQLFGSSGATIVEELNNEECLASVSDTVDGRILVIKKDGKVRLTLPQAPTGRIRVSFDNKSTSRHVEMEWNPFTDSHLSKSIMLNPGEYRVSLWSDRIPRPDGYDIAWQPAGEIISDGCLVRIPYDVLTNGNKYTGNYDYVKSIEIDVSSNKNSDVEEALAGLRLVGGGEVGGPDLNPPLSQLDRSAGIGVVDDLFDVAAEVAIERAESRAGQLFERRVVRTICDELNGKITLSKPTATKDAAATEELELRQTCSVLKSVSLSDGAAAGRALTRALTADVVDSALRLTVLSSACQNSLKKNEYGGCVAGLNEQRLAALLKALQGPLNELVSDVAEGRGWSRDLPQRMVIALAKGIDDNALAALAGAPASTLKSFNALRSLVAAASQCHAQSVCDARAIAELVNGIDGVDSEVAISFVRRAASILDGNADLSERDRVRAAVKLVFDGVLLIAASNENADQLVAMKAVAEIYDAVIVQDLPRALIASAEILTVALKTWDVSPRENESTPTDEAVVRRYRKAIALLSSLTSYVATYGNDAGDDEGRRAQRKKAIEAVVDASTDRTHRAGDFITSVGIQVGALGALGVTPYGDRQLFGPRYSGALSLPLGVSFEGLPGGWDAIDWVGWRASFHAFDLGQYVTVASGETGIARPRFDTAVALGGQLGWLLACPGDHMMPIFVGADVRYAPTLFSSSDPFSIADNGGSLQAGLTVGTYISFFDFN